MVWSCRRLRECIPWAHRALHALLQRTKKSIAYILDLYSKLKGQIITKDWKSDPFEFKRSVFQGDNYSVIIFLVVFNPILTYLGTFKEANGYKLGEKKIITKPFADDFQLITKNKRQHQKIQKIIQDLIISLGMVLKPRKCKSLSICSGIPTDIEFTLRESNPLDQSTNGHTKI